MRTVLFVILITAQKSLFAQWTTQNSGTSAALSKVYFPTADIGYVLLEDGGFLKTTNGGNNWIPQNNPGTAWDFYFISPDTGISVNGNIIKKTVDGGNNWVIKHSDSALFSSIVVFPDKNTGFVIGINNSLNTCYTFRTDDSGENWILQGNFSTGLIYPEDIFFTDKNTGFIASGGNIYKTTDGGQNWAQSIVDSSGDTQIYSIHFPSDSIGYAVGFSSLTGDAMYKTTDAGLTWVIKNTQETNPLYSVYFTSNDVGFTVGGNGLGSGTVIKTGDGGNSWALATSQTQTFASVFFPVANIGYAVGTNGTIIKYRDTTVISVNVNNFISYNKPSLFPNPSSSGIFRMPELMDGSHVTVTDMLGQTLCQQIAESNNPVIDISSYPRGIYFARLQNEEEISVLKLVFQ